MVFLQICRKHSHLILEHASNKEQGKVFICKNTPQNIIVIGWVLWEEEMNYDIDKYELIENIGDRVNQFRTTVEPNLDSYFN